MVLAAASLTDVLPSVVEAWREQEGSMDVVFSFDGSSRLARQVEAGAPADVIFLADALSMDAVERRGLLAPGTRGDLLGNTLVVVVPGGSAWAPQSVAELTDPRVRHLALAAERVPAGRYAREALRASLAWDAVADRVVTGSHVRTTLAWVSRGEAEAGIVYATDAAQRPGVRTALALSPDIHTPIVYPAAVLASSVHQPEARALLEFCAGEVGRARFAAAGFLPAPEAP